MCENGVRRRPKLLMGDPAGGKPGFFGWTAGEKLPRSHGQRTLEATLNRSRSLKSEAPVSSTAQSEEVYRFAAILEVVEEAARHSGNYAQQRIREEAGRQNGPEFFASVEQYLVGAGVLASPPVAVNGTHLETSDTAILGPVPEDLHIEGYEIPGELGRGGMGVVYKAIELKLNREVALKRLLLVEKNSTEDLERFQLEANTLAGLSPPNIVKIYETGSSDGVPYFTLELCHCGDRRSLVQKGPMAPRDAANLVQILAEAMQVATLKFFIVI